MSKMVNEVLGKIKGDGKVNDILTGKGSFSKQGFGDTVSALANDTTFKIKTFDKDGKSNGTVCLSELIRNDVKKTIEKAGYPQKSEAGVLDTSEIVTTGIAEAIPYIVMEQIKCGKKFQLPNTEKSTGCVFLKDVKAKVRESKVRDPQTQKDLGSVTITTKDSVQIRTSSPVPKHLQTKVRKDPSGKVIQ